LYFFFLYFCLRFPCTKSFRSTNDISIWKWTLAMNISGCGILSETTSARLYRLLKTNICIFYTVTSEVAINTCKIKRGNVARFK
jgi:hypothetical protein